MVAKHQSVGGNKDQSLGGYECGVVKEQTRVATDTARRLLESELAVVTNYHKNTDMSFFV